MLQRADVDPRLTLIIPAFNEARRLPLTLRELARYLEQQSAPTEVVLVDDGSKPGKETREEAAPVVAEEPSEG